LLADESWWSRLGDVLVVERLENAEGCPTRLAYYIGGKLDFTLIPANRMSGTTYERPYTVLLDKDGHADHLHLSKPKWTVPSECEFVESVNWAYAAALMCAKAAVRDELWAAKFRDQDLKEQLLQMVEWDHRARYGADYDTRYLGTRMNEWMDQDVRQELLGCWAHLEPVDTAAGLRNTIRLFSNLASRTAAAWGFHPFDHARVHAEIEATLAQHSACV
jgi:aminoglycoside 6-adenylyltransferase